MNLAPSIRKLAVIMEKRCRSARIEPNNFAALAFTDVNGRPLRQAPVHLEMQQFLSAHTRALIELPRDHGKSVQACIRVLWELGRQPALRVKIVCASEALAAERSRFLREAIGRNPRVRAVFPHLRPATPWTATRFSIARPVNIVGPSVTAMGVGAASTGLRADLLVCDDIVDVRAMHSTAERMRVRTYFFENLMNLLEPHGRLWNLFTPWHVNDLNAELKTNAEFALFRRGIDENLTPIWPEKWPRERLEARRREIGDISFARAYRLVPLSGSETPLKPEWIRYWSEPAEYMLKVLAIDPAICAKAISDATALVVLGRTVDLEIHCLAAMARRVPAGDLHQLIADIDREHNPDKILFEENAAFKAICDELKRDRRFGFKVEGVTQSREKGLRVQEFSIPLQQGKFLLKGGGQRVVPDQQELYDEMLSFPGGAHDDLLDAAATGTRFLRNVREPRIL